MTAYFDTGIILKLYTEEPESEAVRAFVSNGVKRSGYVLFIWRNACPHPNGTKLSGVLAEKVRSRLPPCTYT